MSRLKDAAVQQLPYHPQYLAKGTVYDAELSSPISFGRVVPAVAGARRHAAGARQHPDRAARDDARFVEDAARHAVRGGDHRDGVLGRSSGDSSGRHEADGRGHVRDAGAAVPSQRPAPVPVRDACRCRISHRRRSWARCTAIDASGDDHVAVDDEGGATLENSKTRFIAPALALLSLRASIERRRPPLCRS